MRTLKNWYLVELTNLTAIGYVGTQQVQTDTVVEIDSKKKLLITKTETFSLDVPDRVWLSSLKL